MFLRRMPALLRLSRLLTVIERSSPVVRKYAVAVKRPVSFATGPSRQLRLERIVLPLETVQFSKPNRSIPPELRLQFGGLSFHFGDDFS
jgi:hypothetical protein